jgi:hypothetical protein
MSRRSLKLILPTFRTQDFHGHRRYFSATIGGGIVLQSGPAWLRERWNFDASFNRPELANSLWRFSAASHDVPAKRSK